MRKKCKRSKRRKLACSHEAARNGKEDNHNTQPFCEVQQADVPTFKQAEKAASPAVISNKNRTIPFFHPPLFCVLHLFCVLSNL